MNALNRWAVAQLAPQALLQPAKPPTPAAAKTLHAAAFLGQVLWTFARILFPGSRTKQQAARRSRPSSLHDGEHLAAAEARRARKAARRAGWWASHCAAQLRRGRDSAGRRLAATT